MKGAQEIVGISVRKLTRFHLHHGGETLALYLFPGVAKINHEYITSVF